MPSACTQILGSVLFIISVGKTAILDRFITKRFLGSYKSTIGADFLTQEIWVDEKLSTLQIWVSRSRRWLIFRLIC
jgi:hypothetical protein